MFELLQQNLVLQENFAKEMTKVNSEKDELRTLVSRKEQTISSLEKQHLNLLPKQREGEDSAASGHREDFIDVLALNKHHNVLELNIEKASYNFASDDSFKTFVSWVVPWPLRDPLQVTNFGLGSVPRYKHTSLYKFKMNHDNLLAIQKDHLKGICWGGGGERGVLCQNFWGV